MIADGRAVRSAGSPMRGRYLLQNPVWRAWLAANDLALQITRRTRPNAATVAESERPRRILVAVSGHLGDAVIATKAIAQLSRVLPEANIGILTGSWNRQVFEGHSNVRWFHAVDHWKLDRTKGSVLDRWNSYRRTRRAALRAINEVRYDAAADLYAYYPNSADILAAAEIPRRIGFASGGYGPLYTQPIQWEAGWRIADDHRAILRALIPTFDWDDTASYTLPALDEADLARWRERGRELGLDEKPYVVLHPGAGAAHKQWRAEHWIEVARHFAQKRISVLLTGAGTKEEVLGGAIALAVPAATNLSGRLDWKELRCVIAGALLVVSVDTVAAHLAAAENVPCVALLTGIDAPGRWLPDRVHTLTKPVPCSPCFRSRGCREMTCLRDLPVEAVLGAAENSLRRASS